MAESNQNILLENVKTGNLTQAAELLERGADPNYINSEEGVSPMHLAAGLGIEPLCLLLQYNGDPNIKLDDGTTPVHVAAIWGMCDCVQILLANGGDPYLRDKEGLSAEDMAINYQHDDVLQVIKQYMFELNSDDEQTTTPMFTYKRLSLDSLRSDSSSPNELDRNISDTSSGPEFEDSMYNTQRLEDYLHEFARRRRSSMFLSNVQKQIDRYFSNGQKTHLLDVTSPDHPYIEPRFCSPEEYSDDSRQQESLHLNLSTSDTSDSFVTCDGESANLDETDRESSSSTDLSPLYDQFTNTVIKNQKYIYDKDCKKSPFTHKRLFHEVENPKFHIHPEKNSKNFHGNISIEVNSQRQSNMFENILEQESCEKERTSKHRDAKYCIRQPLSTIQPCVSEKCDFCGGVAEKVIKDGIVCASCEKLGLELDDLVGASIEDNYSAANSAAVKQEMNKFDNTVTDIADPQTSSIPDLLGTLPDSTDLSLCIGKKRNWLLAERIKVFDRDKVSNLYQYDLHDQSQNKVNRHKKTDHRCNLVKSDQKSESQGTRNSKDVTDLTSQFKNTHLDVDKQQKSKNMNQNASNQIKLNDSIVSHISSTVNVLDNAQLFTDFEGTFDESFIDKVETLPVKKVPSMKNENMLSKDHNGVKNKSENTNGYVDSKECIDDLWKEIQKCKEEKLAHSAPSRNNVLDTGFCGRQSMCSMYSNASTVDYIYTDKENGITLLERHLPSVCGSQGSRRSVDSQFSVNSNENALKVNRSKSDRSSRSSEDTVLYNWRENAMIMSNDNVSGRLDKVNPDSNATDNKMDDKTLCSKLVNHGDDPGPITNTTRQAYLTRLGKLDNNRAYKKTTSKISEYPPELQLALNGNLNMSDMPGIETKMVAAFQNPDRMRRWREGTLKSSFNYILLDPRVTKNLPNRAVNMSDQDIFQTFISAIFYIGKGKRARPYCHLYEAIKHQKKNNTKMSKKVEKIVEIWDSGMGVVSLHCYQSVIPVEAYTREACMIDAIGLKQLTNQKKGDYYGVSVTFSMKERRKMGVYLLQKALQIFLAEGERQIAPLDIKKS